MDDAAREALEREMVAAFDQAAGSATRDGIVAGFRAAFRRLLTTRAIVPREMTEAQREVISKIGADYIDQHVHAAGDHDEPWFQTPQDAHAAYLAAGEVKLFGEGG